MLKIYHDGNHPRCQLIMRSGNRMRTKARCIKAVSKLRVRNAIQACHEWNANGGSEQNTSLACQGALNFFNDVSSCTAFIRQKHKCWSESLRDHLGYYPYVSLLYMWLSKHIQGKPGGQFANIWMHPRFSPAAHGFSESFQNIENLMPWCNISMRVHGCMQS